jgi:glycerol-3-phosphate dehydrogenase subunit B
MQSEKIIECELAVIGCGMTGIAAALFAANRGISVVQVGGVSEILFASGFFDLLGVYPIEDKHVWDNPWEGIAEIRQSMPEHPYARIKTEDIETAVNEFLLHLEQAGIPYEGNFGVNLRMITPMGILKPTYAVPKTMYNGVEAFENLSACLLVDFYGLKGFSARQLIEVLKDRWPNLTKKRLSFPGTERLSEVYPEQLARSLCVENNREALAKAIAPHAGGVEYIGLPAVLGVLDSHEILNDLQQRIGAKIFEIPTMPPSVPGIRLKEAFDQILPEKGVQQFLHKKVLKAQYTSEGFFVLNIGNEETHYKLRAKGIVLASGRFLGKGLQANRRYIREALFDLPVTQPPNRDQWHRTDFLDPRGHAVNRCGLEIDPSFRPLNRSGEPAFPMLFAAGSILAHQDWMRMKCGSGMAVSTAFAAVKAFVKLK